MRTYLATAALWLLAVAGFKPWRPFVIGVVVGVALIVVVGLFLGWLLDNAWRR